MAHRRSNGRFVAKGGPVPNADDVLVAKAGIGALDPIDGGILGVVQGSDRAGAGASASTMEQYWYLYAKHPWVSCCVNLIAEAVSAETFAVAPVVGASGNAVNAVDDERIGQIHMFFEKATPGSTFAALRLSTAIDLRVFGVSYWRKKRAIAGGSTLFLERLEPRRTTAKLNPKRTKIVAFLLRKTPGTVSDQTIPPEVIPAEDVVFFKMHGGDPLFGPPAPLEALDMTITEDWNIRRHRSAFFRNGGVSGRVIQIDGVDEKTAEKMTKKLRAQKSGADAAFQDLIVPGTGIRIAESSAKSGKNDSDFTKGSEQLRDEIFAVFKVPPGKVFVNGAALGSAGKNADDDTFQRDAVLPVERVIYETMTREILATEFMIDDLRLVPSRMAQLRLDMIDAAKDLLEAGGTPNEARDLMNLPPVDVDGIDMDIPFFLGNKQPIADSEATSGNDADPAKDGDVTDPEKQKGDPKTGGKKVKKAGARARDAVFRR